MSEELHKAIKQYLEAKKAFVDNCSIYESISENYKHASKELRQLLDGHGITKVKYGNYTFTPGNYGGVNTEFTLEV